MKTGDYHQCLHFPPSCIFTHWAPDFLCPRKFIIAPARNGEANFLYRDLEPVLYIYNGVVLSALQLHRTSTLQFHGPGALQLHGSNALQHRPSYMEQVFYSYSV